MPDSPTATSIASSEAFAHSPIASRKGASPTAETDNAAPAMIIATPIALGRRCESTIFSAAMMIANIAIQRMFMAPSTTSSPHHRPATADAEHTLMQAEPKRCHIVRQRRLALLGKGMADGDETGALERRKLIEPGGADNRPGEDRRGCRRQGDARQHRRNEGLRRCPP